MIREPSKIVLIAVGTQQSQGTQAISSTKFEGAMVPGRLLKIYYSQ